MIRTVWLSSVRIKIDELIFSQDCYGTSEESIWLIESKSYNGVTKVIESWSLHHG